MKRLIILAAIALAACSDYTAPPSAPSADDVPSFTRSSSQREGFVTVAPVVRLHYIDFGGRGEVIVFLAGLGNTAHVFEQFAPRLTDRFHVIALTRRGFGQSSLALDGYDTRSLSEDIRIVLDSLRLRRVVLVGHSIAGDEMTRFAGDHPERVDKLVYLDAAYDRLAIRAMIDAHPLPAPPYPVLADITSLRSFSRYVSRVHGVTLPMGELRAQWQLASDGSVVAEVTPIEVYLAILGGEESPDYTRVRAPALGIFAVAREPGDVAPWLVPRSIDWAAVKELLVSVLNPFYDGQREHFDTEVRRSTVLRLNGANHYVFISDADRVERALRSFLEAQ
jgi:pimeloyl-ACP methyl ester carboxylesterase